MRFLAQKEGRRERERERKRKEEEREREIGSEASAETEKSQTPQPGTYFRRGRVYGVLRCSGGETSTPCRPEVSALQFHAPSVAFSAECSGGHPSRYYLIVTIICGYYILRVKRISRIFANRFFWRIFEPFFRFEYSVKTCTILSIVLDLLSAVWVQGDQRTRPLHVDLRADVELSQ